jgi:activator of 2-hydroxyglutaryl-CoA dehydratase
MWCRLVSVLVLEGDVWLNEVLSCGIGRYMEKMSQLRRLQLAEVDEVAFQGITLKDLVCCWIL